MLCTVGYENGRAENRKGKDTSVDDGVDGATAASSCDVDDSQFAVQQEDIDENSLDSTGRAFTEDASRWGVPSTCTHHSQHVNRPRRTRPPTSSCQRHYCLHDVVGGLSLRARDFVCCVCCCFCWRLSVVGQTESSIGC